MKMKMLAAVVMSFFWMSAFAALTNNGDGTVTDRNTNRTWQKCSVGQSGNECVDSPAIEVDWESAISACETSTVGGFGDWRLPNIKELRSLVDMSVSYPAVNSAHFPNINSGGYWSSTSYADPAVVGHAWTVRLSASGETVNAPKTSLLSILCVRGP